MTSQEKIRAAQTAIIEAQSVTRDEMKIRQSNAGIPGTVAHKVVNRDKYDDQLNEYTLEEQASRLAQWLTDEEAEYITNNW